MHFFHQWEQTFSQVGTILPTVGALLPTVDSILPTVLSIPDIYNNQYCPNILPLSNQFWPLSLPHGTSCSYGELSCCNDCCSKTTCLANFGTFQCLTTDILCTIDFLLQIIPVVCIVKKKVWPDLVGLLHFDANVIILKEEPCVSKVNCILGVTPVALRYIKTQVCIIYGAWSGRIIQTPPPSVDKDSSYDDMVHGLWDISYPKLVSAH